MAATSLGSLSRRELFLRRLGHLFDGVGAILLRYGSAAGVLAMPSLGVPFVLFAVIALGSMLLLRDVAEDLAREETEGTRLPNSPKIALWPRGVRGLVYPLRAGVQWCACGVGCAAAALSGVVPALGADVPDALARMHRLFLDCALGSGSATLFFALVFVLLGARFRFGVALLTALVAFAVATFAVLHAAPLGWGIATPSGWAFVIVEAAALFDLVRMP